MKDNKVMPDWEKEMWGEVDKHDKQRNTPPEEAREQILPCPFCGCEVTRENTPSSGMAIYHKPNDCILVTPTTGLYISPSIERWNQRAKNIEVQA